MFKVLKGAACGGVTASADPWIPLTVAWHVSFRGGPLYLYVSGDDGGFVEFNVTPDTGTLCALVVIDLPPLIDRPVESALAAPGSLSPMFDLGLWEWKVTPDYQEPVRVDIDATSALAYSTPDDLFALWFSRSPVSRFLECGEARVGVSRADELVSVVVRRPVVITPELSKGAAATSEPDGHETS